MKSKYVLLLLTLITSLIWLIALYLPDDNLHIIACDVGQGDAILITHGSDQILVDAGKGRSVMDCLGEHLPFWDKTIEMLVITHPQLDHYGGFNDVLTQYSALTILTTTIDSDAVEYRALKTAIVNSGAKIIEAKKGKSVKIGMMQFDILAPTEDVIAEKTVPISDNVAGNILGSRTTDTDPNELSIIARLSYGEFDALLTADIGPAVIADLVSGGLFDDVEYVKVPHHGSRNGLTQELLDTATPELAVISSGKNPWGHPHEEVLELLKNAGIKTLRTDGLGSVEVVSDGEGFWLSD